MRDGLFWINNHYDNTKVPEQTLRNLGRIDTSRRVGCRWTVTLLMADPSATASNNPPVGSTAAA